MSVVFDRPYQFVPPHRGDWWPTLIQAFRLVDRYLQKAEGVVDYELRGLEHWQRSLDRGDGILLAPNHCRYADPLVMVWPARRLHTHLFAMASWHLFNTNRYEKWALRKMGAFSIYREGPDRQSLETAISILAAAQRPLVLFPEGTTNRTNDVLKPLLEGVAFIARTAARKRAKECDGRVVMHPIALKYLCTGNAFPWCDAQLAKLETRFGWTHEPAASILQRTVRVAEALLALKEIQHLGRSQTGPLPERRDQLIEHLLSECESQLGLSAGDGVQERVRAIRAEASATYFNERLQDSEPKNTRGWMLRETASKAILAQDLLSYLDYYLQEETVTDTRIVETIQRMQESLLGKADPGIPLKVIIQCDEAIEIPASKATRNQADPIMSALRERLEAMLTQLSSEANPASEVGLA